MSKSFKDQANYFKHHTQFSNDSMFSNKRNLTEDDIPEGLKNKVNLLNTHWNAALRHGNSRKVMALTKVKNRRTQRAKNKQQYMKEISQ